MPQSIWMSPPAKVYLNTVVGTGAYMLVSGLFQFSAADLREFFVYLALAILGATWKVKLPGMRASVSMTFAFILIGIANLSLGEAVVIGGAATVVQCLWRSSERASTRRVVFNVATAIIGVTVAYNPPHFELSQGLQNASTMLPLAALLYFVANTGLISGMIALTEEEPFRAVWRNLTQYSIGYCLAGGLIGTLMIVSTRWWGWGSGVLMAPLLYLTYRTYRYYLRRRHMLPGS